MAAASERCGDVARSLYYFVASSNARNDDPNDFELQAHLNSYRPSLTDAELLDIMTLAVAFAGDHNNQLGRDADPLERLKAVGVLLRLMAFGYTVLDGVMHRLAASAPR